MGVRSNSIPRSIIALIGGRNEPGIRTYLLYKDGELLVVEAPPSTISQDGDYDQMHDRECWEKEYDYTLEKIQTAARTIDFGRTNWAYTILQPDGGCRIVHRNRPTFKVTYPTWAPVVDEGDIEITKWISAEERLGIWKGQEVDLLVGWDDRRLKEIEQTMRAYRLLQGLDLTFEILAHVARDGQVVGVVMEPAIGRMVEHCDRAQVFEAIARVESRGLLYGSIHQSNIMISGGKVRLTNIATTRPFTPDEPEEKQYHWTALRLMFDSLRGGVNFMTPPRTWPQQLQYIPSPLAPERPRPSFVKIWFVGTNTLLFPEEPRKKRTRTAKRLISGRTRPQENTAEHATSITSIHSVSARLLERNHADYPYPRSLAPRRIPNDKQCRSGSVLLLPLLPSYDSDATCEEEDRCVEISTS
ncbi:hypothetical protein EYR38_010554 [Pleurotus pulmonarius]|nr:hypothetical protein EYR38_010554 [Pleurotus pulmonarius]